MHAVFHELAHSLSLKRGKGPYLGSRDCDRKMLWFHLTEHASCGMVRYGSFAGVLPWLKDKAVSLVDLELDLHLTGRAPKALAAEVLRELNQSDLALLATERGIQPTSLQRITNRHHALARCLASGMSATEAGLCTGYTGSRISVLRGDPAFEELIAFYQSEKNLPVQDLNDKLVAVAADSAALLLERMELEPEKFSNGELQDQLKLGADRTGHGPKSTNVNVNVNLGDRMKAARERAAAVPSSRTMPARDLGAPVRHGAGVPTIIDADYTEVQPKERA